jgi:DNA-directed RNA polymerase specialized sigma24 family protein
MALAELKTMKAIANCPVETFVELYYQPVFRFAARLCHNPLEALALTQRTFGVALERRRHLPVPRNARAWLITILFHQFLNSRLNSAWA